METALKNDMDGVLICYIHNERKSNQTFILLILFQTW